MSEASVKKNPKVTIAMPVFNGGKYFPQAVDSALAQTYQNIEIVVCNDGSDDDGYTHSICEALAARYPDKIKYIHQENTGVAGALNTILDHATGDIFTWLSHDDLFVPEKIQKQVDFHAKINNPDACLFANYGLINREGLLYLMLGFTVDHLKGGGATCLPRGMINGCTIYVPMHIMRDVGYFDVDRRNSQDYAYWNELLRDYDFYYQPECLVLYRIHPGQGTNSTEAVIEGDVLWTEIIDARRSMAAVQPWGNQRRFLKEIAAFLANTPYTKATQFARERLAENLATGPLVSVILPIYNEAECAIRAIESVLSQTYRNFELIVIDDGSSANMSAVHDLCRTDRRIRLIVQQNGGAAAARNAGIDLSRGDYICFLDADDTFIPNKIAVQLERMLESGAMVSHTSYFVYYPEVSQARGVIGVGAQTGKLYPGLIGGCSVATPTVMINRLVADAGHRFPTDHAMSEDVCLWVDLALEYEFLGIDECLSEIEWSITSAALRLDKGAEGIRNAYETFSKHPIHSLQTAEVNKLRSLTKAHERRRDAIQRRVSKPKPVDFLDIEALQFLISEDVALAVTGNDVRETAVYRQSEYMSVTQNEAYGRVLSALGERTCLFITNAPGGGVERHIRELYDFLQDDGLQVLVGRIHPATGALFLGFLSDDFDDMCPIDLTAGRGLLVEILRDLQIDFVHIHGLVGLTFRSIKTLYRALLDADVPYYYTCHDYTAISPSLHLAGANGEYVGRLSEMEENRIIAYANGSFGRTDVRHWREAFDRLLKSAERVIAPSRDVLERIRDVYPDAPLILRSHDLIAPKSITNDTASDLPIRIGIIGPVGTHKGSDRLVDLARFCAIHHPDVEFVIYGITDRDEDLLGSNNVTILGEFKESTFHDLYFRSGCDVFFFPSTIPETYSFRLSEVLGLDIPIVAFDIGAIAERMRHNDKSELLDASSANTLHHIASTLLKSVFRDRAMNDESNSAVQPNTVSAYYDIVTGEDDRRRITLSRLAIV